MTEAEVFTEVLLSMQAIHGNLAVLTYNRAFAALIVGSILGIVGYSGWSGFLWYFLMQALMGLLIKTKLGSAQPKKYFQSKWAPYTHEVVSSSSMLTFVTAWTLTFSCVHVF
mmetsp:Transcript_3788/g.10902  ORF Transcript_3788/g.10902 Transcript_3788/m.10902 type:complete len:112 (-) Transcript_3788:318-653(-)